VTESTASTTTTFREHVAMSDVRLTCTAADTRGRTGEEGEYGCTVHGSVLVRSADGTELNVGWVEATLYKINRAIKAGWDSVADVLEAHNEESAQYIELCSGGDGNIAMDVVEQCGLNTRTPNLLIVERIYIDRAYRGYGLGLHAMRALLDTFRRQAQLVACQPYPFVGYDDREPKLVSRAESTAGQQKLRAYWSTAGFTQVGKSSIFVRSSKPRQCEER
jgi:hypothetical protein